MSQHDEHRPAALTNAALVWAERFDQFAMQEIAPALAKMMANYCQAVAAKNRELLGRWVDTSHDITPSKNADEAAEADRLWLAQLEEIFTQRQEELNRLVRELLLWDQDLGVDQMTRYVEKLRSLYDPNAQTHEKHQAIRAVLEPAESPTQWRRRTVTTMIAAIEEQSTDPATVLHYLKHMLAEQEDW